ncbi:MAG: GxxExxY protein [Chthoniobacteraceae bacterium]
MPNLSENEIAQIAVDAAFHIHQELGPGLLESVYEVVLARALEKRGLAVVRQKPVPIFYDGVKFDEGFRADMVVQNKLLIELKSVETIAPVHKKQLLTYLRLSGTRLGLLINFGSSVIRNGIFRVVNGLDE